MKVRGSTYATRKMEFFPPFPYGGRYRIRTSISGLKVQRFSLKLSGQKAETGPHCTAS
ncbi:hypothetical protein HMPREF0083_01072 [Aneurinibacillus aneurinilyticus ATCC 12856]|uniref:Uncharacterized protein n=1 Tax=Aneurinibacillus aneurinilyticus ATCC 12856 TaxID=649747 RepID=U1YJ79_ANEAE|nr:hypothetical protein HMPREF0083_01072 [Aneurinibacillus aneurinilyticus ATCC 12856]